MIVKFDKLFENKDELRNIDMKDPFYVAEIILIFSSSTIIESSSVRG